MTGARSKLNEPMAMLVLMFQPISSKNWLRYTPQYLETTEPAMSIFKDQIPANHPCHDLADGGVGEGVGGSRHWNHGGEFGVAHHGGAAHDACDQEAQHHRRTGMEGSRLRADGEDACAHGNGHTHDGKIPTRSDRV